MRIVTKKEFAELAGVSRPAVSYLIRTEKIPVTDDGRIDMDDEKCAEYLASKGAKPSDGPPPEPESKPAGGRAAIFSNRKKSSSSKPKSKLGGGVTKSDVMVRRELEMKKLAADAQYRELKNAQMEGRLVAREAMIRGVWNPLETFLTRLLSDGAKTIAAKVFPIGRSGGTVEEAEVEVRKQMTTLISPLRRSMQRSLKIENV